jgi:chemotaxis protein MotB
MRRRRIRARSRATHERWLVSYADFITLLFAFFVVLYAARVDKKNAGQVSVAIQNAFKQMGALPAGQAEPGSRPAVAPLEAARISPPDLETQNKNLDALAKQLQNTLQPEILRGSAAVHDGPDGLTVSLREAGFFESGSADIKPNARSAFARMAEVLRGHGYHIRIEGHTDNQPIHNGQFASNWELSTGRATELVRLLIMVYNFPPELLSAAGYGEYHPIAGNDTDSGRAKNRRVDVVILRERASAPPAQ